MAVVLDGGEALVCCPAVRRGSPLPSARTRQGECFTPVFHQWAESAKRQVRTLLPTACPPDEKRRNSEPNHRVLPPGGHGGIDLRPPRGERWEAGAPAARGQAHHHRHAGADPGLHGRVDDRRYAAAAGTSGAAGKARSARQFPLLREPAEISAVRPHLQREAGGRRARGARTRQHPSAASGAARVRRRRRRRHGAGARAAVDAPALSAHAVLCRRQGVEPRGRPPDPGQGAGPAVRASGLGVRLHQHALCGGALADAGVACGRCRHCLARGAAAGRLIRRLRDADRRA